MTRVGFQGVPGAYSEQAIRQFFGPDVESIPFRTFDEIFVAVERGDADYGMQPVENAVAGSVASAYQLLTEHVWDGEAFLEGELNAATTSLLPLDEARLFIGAGRHFLVFPVRRSTLLNFVGFVPADEAVPPSTGSSAPVM